ncbi:hypothetical protein E0Y62_06020 [Cytobacillus praedii]|uniref:Uncharacterized protein n=2 Tax=Cytobacillus praedii TaxID=1742358 RepID=A0A4R1B2R0_9BACI|nr:hypothetical protein E0Y62_06020 [Cytobacillus praedii]
MFWHKRRKNDLSYKELQKQLDDLQKRIDSMKDHQKAEYHFHIDRVDIHQPVLDQLSFHLDQIDIEELSGALNVGNNFGVNIGSKKGKGKKNEGERRSQDNSLFKTTKEGYSITLKDKEAENDPTIS